MEKINNKKIKVIQACDKSIRNLKEGCGGRKMVNNYGYNKFNILSEYFDLKVWCKDFNLFRSQQPIRYSKGKEGKNILFAC